MNRTLSVVSILVTVMILASGCKKSSKDDLVVRGKVALYIKAYHHTWPVPYLDVYLKKDALGWPGTEPAAYDMSSTTDNTGKASFTFLFPGKYFVFATGYDSLFGAHVLGYGPVIINDSTVLDDQLEMILFVNE